MRKNDKLRDLIRLISHLNTHNLECKLNNNNNKSIQSIKSKYSELITLDKYHKIKTFSIHYEIKS